MKVKFYLTGSGRSPIEEFLQGCSAELQANFFDAINLLNDGRVLQMPLSRNLSSVHAGLHEIRLKDRAGQVRVFYFVKRGNAIYLLHAMRKRTQELPKKDLDLVLKRIREI